MFRWFDENKKAFGQAMAVFWLLFGLVIFLAYRYDFSNIDTKALLFIVSTLCSLLIAKNTFDEAKTAILESVSVMGRNYQATLEKGLGEERWVDLFSDLDRCVKRPRRGRIVVDRHTRLLRHLANAGGDLVHTFGDAFGRRLRAPVPRQGHGIMCGVDHHDAGLGHIGQHAVQRDHLRLGTARGLHRRVALGLFHLVADFLVRHAVFSHELSVLE